MEKFFRFLLPFTLLLSLSLQATKLLPRVILPIFAAVDRILEKSSPDVVIQKIKIFDARAAQLINSGKITELGSWSQFTGKNVYSDVNLNHPVFRAQKLGLKLTAQALLDIGFSAPARPIEEEEESKEIPLEKYYDGPTMSTLLDSTLSKLKLFTDKQKEEYEERTKSLDHELEQKLAQPKADLKKAQDELINLKADDDKKNADWENFKLSAEYKSSWISTSWPKYKVWYAAHCSVMAHEALEAELSETAQSIEHNGHQAKQANLATFKAEQAQNLKEFAAKTDIELSLAIKEGLATATTMFNTNAYSEKTWEENKDPMPSFLEHSLFESALSYIEAKKSLDNYSEDSYESSLDEIIASAKLANINLEHKKPAPSGYNWSWFSYNTPLLPDEEDIAQKDPNLTKAYKAFLGDLVEIQLP